MPDGEPFSERYDSLVLRRGISSGNHGKMHIPADLFLDGVPDDDPLCEHEGHDGFRDDVEFVRKPSECYPAVDGEGWYPNCDNCEGALVDTVPPHRDPEWLYEKYYEDELSAPEVGDLAGVTGPTIRKWMERHGIPRRPLSEARKLAAAAADPDREADDA